VDSATPAENAPLFGKYHAGNSLPAQIKSADESFVHALISANCPLIMVEGFDLLLSVTLFAQKDSEYRFFAVPRLRALPSNSRKPSGGGLDRPL